MRLPRGREASGGGEERAPGGEEMGDNANVADTCERRGGAARRLARKGKRMGGGRGRPPSL